MSLYDATPNNANPMMKCGHAANAVNGQGNPSCVICVGIHPGAEEIDTAPPILEGRRARCHHYDKLVSVHHNESSQKPVDGKGKCMVEVASHTGLPFFENKPGAEFDEFYCGCWGWD